MMWLQATQEKCVAIEHQMLRCDSCGCAGIFSAPLGIEIYAHIFDQADRLAQLEGFASQFGPRFYGLPENQTNIVLEKSAIQIPVSYQPNPELIKDFKKSDLDALVPLLAGQSLNWCLAKEE